MTPATRGRLIPYLGSIALVLLATGGFLLFQHRFNSLDLALSYLIVLTVLSLRVGTGPAIAAPLASIKAAATSLLQSDVMLPEADRLNQLVANLLDLLRIESGALKPAFGCYDLSDVIYGAIERVRPLARGHRLTLDLDEELPLFRMDFIEVGQVLVNLLFRLRGRVPVAGPDAPRRGDAGQPGGRRRDARALRWRVVPPPGSAARGLAHG